MDLPSKLGLRLLRHVTPRLGMPRDLVDLVVVHAFDDVDFAGLWG